MENWEKLMHHIKDEVKDARCYIQDAMETRATDPETADLYYRLSGEELNHMTALHKDVVRLIENYRKEKGEVPEPMMILYKYLHGEAMEEAEKVGILQTMYKNKRDMPRQSRQGMFSGLDKNHSENGDCVRIRVQW